MKSSDDNTYQSVILVLHPSRTKWGGFFLFYLFLFWSGVADFSPNNVMAYLGIILGLGGACCCFQLLVNKKFNLTLTVGGFTFGTFQGLHSYRWGEVEKFYVEKRNGLELVRFVLRRGENRKHAAYKTLPGTYGKYPHLLLEILEDFRLRQTKP